MRIGIFGSKVDPIHYGHLIIAECARVQYSLDIVYFVVAGQPVDKAACFFDKETRFKSVAAAIADNPKFRASDVEVNRQGPSYMVDTLRHFHNEHGDEKGTEYFLIIGEDRVPTISSWYKANEIIQLATFLVAPRGSRKLYPKRLVKKMPPGTKVNAVESPGFAVSSTFLREQINGGRSIRYMVPDKAIKILKRALRKS
jgi:nicotinate-nucleotide adenylyltransferase